MIVVVCAAAGRVLVSATVEVLVSCSWDMSGGLPRWLSPIDSAMSSQLAGNLLHLDELARHRERMQSLRKLWQFALSGVDEGAKQAHALLDHEMPL